MITRKLSKQEAYDLVIGAKILACGGGGSEERSIENIKKIYDKGENFTIANLSDLKDNDSICIIGMVGGGITEEDRKLVENREITISEPMVTAVKELESFLNLEFSGFVATELGPNNSVVPMMVAAKMGKVAINGDCCGRSKPMISISTTRVANIPMTPFAIVSQYGDIQIVGAEVDDMRGELIARNASKLSGGSVSVARCPMRIEDAKKAVIPHTYSLAINLGKNVREANEKGDDTISIIQDSIPDSRIAFKGVVRTFFRREEGGFTSGEIVLESEKGKKVKIWYQNEYLLSWLNEKKYITCPDGFYIVDSTTGYGLTPWEEDFSKGREITIFTRDAPEIWKSEKGLDVFGPEVFDKNWGPYRDASSLL
ncbi:MAG: DUF917 domain-containing protein [Candidatus Heimdallarchaeota archaeon]|nr:DUF917 domain-containing protein [Candidatus Heimdallarchaeota archaeon]